jgi:GDPmannose 4,6-dehydratase
VELGNLDSKRDWGHAKEYVRAMWLMLQCDFPFDYVVATGEQHSVREFVELVAKEKGFSVTWSGEGFEEIGTDPVSGRVVVRVNPSFYRPCEVDMLVGDSSLIKRIGWTPEYSFQELVKNMCEH